MIVRVFESAEEGDAHTIIQYRSLRPPTQDDIKRAKELDKFLELKMMEIQEELQNLGLLDSRLGNLARWHALGKRVAGFVDNPDIVLPEDRAQDRYIWEAISQHAPDELHPGKKASQSKNVGSERNHFRLCYLVAAIQDDFNQAEEQGNWREWVELLESKTILQDERILNWVRMKLINNPQIKLRPLVRVLRSWLKDMYTIILSDEELEGYLEEAWNEMREIHT